MNFFTQAFPPSLKDYYDSLIANLTFDATNTATGTTSVSMTGRSGVAIFTDEVTSSPKFYYINNDDVASSSSVEVFLITTDSDDTFAEKIGQYLFDGQIQVCYTDAGENPAGVLKLGWRIL